MTGSRFNVASSAETIPLDAWQRCNFDDNIFTSRDFFLALEKTGSAAPSQGWYPCHGILREGENVLAITPLYVKSHSLGEYVFDQIWAKAYMQAGGQYYPKLVGCVPFTPVSGARILCGLTGSKAEKAKRSMAAQIVEMYRSATLSSAHLTFCAADEAALLSEENWLIRRGLQYHWYNDGYADFDDFLNALTSRKRKMVRKERALASSYGLTFSTRRGDELRPDEWQRVDALYRATTDRRWGAAYLASNFFAALSNFCGRHIILMTASLNNEIVAAAINIWSGDTIFGRYWCCAGDWPALHFELCYYRSIEWAIAQRLKRVEAGAQGTHKILRGYRPTYTWSAHHFAHDGLRSAVTRFLETETSELAAQKRAFEALLPYRHVFNCE